MVDGTKIQKKFIGRREVGVVRAAIRAPVCCDGLGLLCLTVLVVRMVFVSMVAGVAWFEQRLVR